MEERTCLLYGFVAWSKGHEVEAVDEHHAGGYDLQIRTIHLHACGKLESVYSLEVHGELDLCSQ